MILYSTIVALSTTLVELCYNFFKGKKNEFRKNTQTIKKRKQLNL